MITSLKHPRLFGFAPRMKSKNWCLLGGRQFILPLIYLFFLHIHTSEAVCPTRFYAQAVTLQRASELDIYFSRAQVETAADCSIFCGKRQFCRSAVYNHDTKSCALSYDKVVECNTQKQRYNTFHLTTDGAESISIITCVELCARDKPKFQDSKPATLDLNVPEHGNGNSGQFVAISKGRTKLKPDGTVELPPEIVVSETPSTQIIEALQRLMNQTSKTANNLSLPTGKPAQSGQLIGRIQTETQLNTNGEKELDNKKQETNSTDSINSLGIQTNNFNSQNSLKTHQKINKKTHEINLDNKEDKHKLTSNDLITSESTNHNNKVRFHAQPLEIQEIFNGTSNSSSLGQGEVYHSGGAQDRNSGGFFKWLTPGERFTLPPEVKLPPEVARLVPELLSAVGRGQSGKLKGTGLSFEITEKDTMPQKINSTAVNSTDSQMEPKHRTLTRFAKIKVDGEDSKETDKVNEKSAEEKVKEVFDSAASNLDQIVVNGRLLSADEISKLKNHEFSSSTTTTTVKPWKPANPLFGSSEEDDEDNTATTKTPAINQPHRDSKPNGFLNTFLIQGISSMIHQNDALHPPKPKLGNLEKHSVFTSTTHLPLITTTSSGPIVCYRQIPQQVLLYASFETLHGISLNECRCRCAETWLNITTDNPESGQLHCKSVLYNEITRECSLNQGDHNGKYDLIYDKFIDYHYVSCEIKYLLSAARRVCAKILPSIAQNLPSPLKIRRPNDNDENTSEHLLRDQQHTQKHDEEEHMTEPKRLQVMSHPDSTTTVETPAATPINLDEPESSTPQTHRLAATTKEILKLQKIEESSTKTTNQLSTQTQKIPTIELTVTPAPATTTSVPKVQTTTGEGSDLLIQEVNPQPKTRNVIRPQSEKQENAVIQQTTTQTTQESTTQQAETTKQQTTPVLSSTTTTSYDPLTISGYTIGCFEIIEGYSMQNAAGGLERNVESLSDCQCYCANSLNSKRYAFQCLSATYYPEEQLCALNLDNRQIRPESFERRAVDAGNKKQLICTQQKANANERASISTTIKPVAVNSDDCFLELPNYVLEGVALAVETNVSVQECKCFCVDSERRYGVECQSAEYYYESQTCLLNKENRISDPDNFNYDAHGTVHSYFDYKCHAEKLTLAVYVEQICRKAIDLKSSDVKPTTDTSLDIEDNEHDNEVRLVTQTQQSLIDDDSEETTQRVKVLKFINESEDDDASEVSDEEFERKERKKLKHKYKFKHTKSEPTAASLTSTTSGLLVLERSSEKHDSSQSRQKSRQEASGKRVAEAVELEGEEQLKRVEATSTTTTSTTTTSPPTTSRRPIISATRAITTKRPISTTEEPSTTTQKNYLPVGQCRYSALYQTAFNGERLIHRFKVQNAIQCFAGCHWEKCRSANLIQSDGSSKFCELYRDSIVDFRRTDVLYFDRDTVHFDSISCNEKPDT
ncbi:hypothetical protein M3Y97_00167700 [Aphelenchoides bicaudatus]|nr:hypothetical protein M3Y97_00167700 [Aphelenchoides bicaudatus]